MAWSKAKQMKFLSDAPLIRVATVNRSGKPQVTPVCHVVWKEKIYWASDFDAAKLANLKRRPWVAWSLTFTNRIGATPVASW